MRKSDGEETKKVLSIVGEQFFGYTPGRSTMKIIL